MRPDSDCLVVGAGLVGSVTALALAHDGLEVHVIDSRAAAAVARGDDVRALVLSAASVRILERYGVWARLAGFSCPIAQIRIRDQGGFATVELNAEDVGLATLGWACPADRMLAACNDALLDNTRIKLAWSTRFRAARGATHAIEVDTERDGPGVLYTTRLLVGADGTDSSVRAHCGVALDYYDYAQQAVVANVRVSRPRAHTAFEHFTRAGPLAFLPVGGARYVSVQCLPHGDAEHAGALDDAAYADLLTERSGGRLGHIEQVGPRRRHNLVRQQVKTPVSARCVVLGNAANTLHPNAAQGLNLGLRDVAALAARVHACDDPGAPAVLAAYARARLDDHRQTGLLTDLLAQAFRSPLGVVSAARRGAMQVLAGCSAARRHLIVAGSGLAALADADHLR